jgi:hypothetical protein
MLLVITIIGVLVSLNLSAINGVTRRANEALCGVYKNQMKVFYYGDYESNNRHSPAYSPAYTQQAFMQRYTIISKKCWECHPSFPFSSDLP